ncbi:roundabout homolog 1-like [Babylonia areolata]|uniref:roundabout homolog 1-like n=1 Tax=Babylonia areolata TaxID=304850 RepID=UPI003FD007D3
MILRGRRLMGQNKVFCPTLPSSSSSSLERNLPGVMLDEEENPDSRIVDVYRRRGKPKRGFGVRVLNLDDVELSGPLPRFLPTPTFYSVAVGDTAILECGVVELDDKKVIWRRASDSNPLTVGRESFHEDNRIMSEHEPHSNYWNLLIHRVQLRDAGVYECQVSSKLRHLRHHVLLQVHAISISGSSVVDRDGTIFLRCNATGQDHSPDDLDWFIEGNKLSTSSDEKVSIRKFVSLTDRTIVSILEIQNAQLGDSGLYTCRTSNLQVRSMHVAVLNKRAYG